MIYDFCTIDLISNDVMSSIGKIRHSNPILNRICDWTTLAGSSVTLSKTLYFLRRDDSFFVIL